MNRETPFFHAGKIEQIVDHPFLKLDLAFQLVNQIHLCGSELVPAVPVLKFHSCRAYR